LASWYPDLHKIQPFDSWSTLGGISGSTRRPECDTRLEDGAHATINDTSLGVTLSETIQPQLPLEFDVLSISSLAYTAGHSGSLGASVMVNVATQVEPNLLDIQSVSVSCQTELGRALPPRLPGDLPRRPHPNRPSRSRRSSSSSSSSHRCASSSGQSESSTGMMSDDCQSDVEILLGGGCDGLQALSYSEFNALPHNAEGQRMSAASLPHFTEGGRCQACVFHRKAPGTCRMGALCFFCHADHAPIARPRRRPPRRTPPED
jgi:hypothetical protein